MDIKENQQVWYINFFDQETGSGVETSVNEELAQELHKLLKNKKRKVKEGQQMRKLLGVKVITNGELMIANLILVI